MDRLLRHPLLQTMNDLKKAFVLNGFVFADNEFHPEIEKEDFSIPAFHEPEAAILPPIRLLKNGSYTLRTRLLPGILTKLPKGAPLLGAVSGKVFQETEDGYPTHFRIEGVIAMPDLRLNSYGVLWNRIAEGAFGIGSRVTLEKTDKKTYTMKVITREGKEYALGWTGETDWLIAEYLGVRKPGIKSWTFIIDIDTLTMQRFGITSRDALYTKDVSCLAAYPYSEISVGRTIEDRASDVLRSMGYTEFIGPTIYEPGVYKKMNMFQDEWDTNNKGVPLTIQDAQNDALRTVLAPSLEQALSENWQAGNQSVKIFEIGHIFLPKGKHDKDKTPYEKTALSVGAYGPDMNYEVFTEEVINILKGLGVNFPYFVESEGAIAYHPKECSLIMNRMGGYLFGNFGQISVKAQRNYGIGVPAYMAQLELQPLEAERIAEFQKNPEDK